MSEGLLAQPGGSVKRRTELQNPFRTLKFPSLFAGQSSRLLLSTGLRSMMTIPRDLDGASTKGRTPVVFLAVVEWRTPRCSRPIPLQAFRQETHFPWLIRRYFVRK